MAVGMKLNVSDPDVDKTSSFLMFFDGYLPDYEERLQLYEAAGVCSMIIVTNLEGYHAKLKKRISASRILW